MANVTFGDLTRILKYNRQIRKAMKAVKYKKNTDRETSESEDDGAEVIRKNPKKVLI